MITKPSTAKKIIIMDQSLDVTTFQQDIGNAFSKSNSTSTQTLDDLVSFHNDSFKGFYDNTGTKSNTIDQTSSTSTVV